jgi:hypothetical protein
LGFWPNFSWQDLKRKSVGRHASGNDWPVCSHLIRRS